MKRFNLFVVLLFALFLFRGMVFADETRKVLVGKLNINDASKQDFLLLPGIGEKTAQRIVKYREDADGFKAVVQIKEVKGLGGKVYNDIKDYLTITDKSNLKVLIDINTATIPSLKMLPGITPKEANAVIEYRKRNKAFKKVDELQLAGIKKEKFEEIKGLVTVLEPEPVKKKPL